MLTHQAAGKIVAAHPAQAGAGKSGIRIHGFSFFKIKILLAGTIRDDACSDETERRQRRLLFPPKQVLGNQALSPPADAGGFLLLPACLAALRALQPMALRFLT
jgi:hypothetical protein